MRWLIFLVLLIPVAAACPDINTTTKLDQDLQCEKGFTIRASLDCQGHTVEGPRTSTIVVEDAAVIQDCTFTKFYTGLEIRADDVVVRRNTFEDNSIGIAVISGSATISNNTADNYAWDLLLQDSDVQLEDNYFSKVQNLTKPKEANTTEAVEETNTSEVVERQLNTSTVEGMDISKQVRYEQNQTTYTITITAQKAVDNLTVVEQIPKELAPHASAISSDTPYTVREEDPVLAFSVGPVEEGETKVITYRINKNLIDVEASPSTLLELEEKINPREKTSIRLFYGLFVILLLLTLYIRRPSHHHHYLLKLLLLLGVTATYFVDITVAIPVGAHETAILIALGAANTFLAGEIVYLLLQRREKYI